MAVSSCLVSKNAKTAHFENSRARTSGSGTSSPGLFGTRSATGPKVSAVLPIESEVEVLEADGGVVLAIHVPRAPRDERPRVYQ